MSNLNFYNEPPVESYKKSDTVFILMTLLLTGLGLVTLYIASAYRSSVHFSGSTVFLSKQLIAVGIGIAGLIFFATVKIEFIRKMMPVLYIFAIVLCFITGFVGENYGTFARRWITIPGLGISFQPSELIKFVLVLFLANQFDKRENVGPAVLGLVICMVVVLVHDFSTGVLIGVVGLIMFAGCGAKLLWMIPGSLLLIPLGGLFVFRSAHRVERIINFVKPEQNLSEGNYQVSKALAAVSSGGWFGQGFGTGLVKTEYVPEVASDYIFAGYAEAFGFVGILLFIVIFAIFAWRIFYHAFSCYDKFTSYVCFGFGTILVVQTILNIGIVAGCLPSTGIPLPFFSAGGTSIVMTLSMCGFVINASRREKIEKETRIEDVVYE